VLNCVQVLGCGEPRYDSVDDAAMAQPDNAAQSATEMPPVVNEQEEEKSKKAKKSKPSKLRKLFARGRSSADTSPSRAVEEEVQERSAINSSVTQAHCDPSEQRLVADSALSQSDSATDVATGLSDVKECQPVGEKDDSKKAKKSKPSKLSKLFAGIKSSADGSRSQSGSDEVTDNSDINATIEQSACGAELAAGLPSVKKNRRGGEKAKKSSKPSVFSKLFGRRKSSVDASRSQAGDDEPRESSVHNNVSPIDADGDTSENISLSNVFSQSEPLNEAVCLHTEDNSVFPQIEADSRPNDTPLSDPLNEAICLPTEVVKVPLMEADSDVSGNSSPTKVTALSDGLSEAVCLPTHPQVPLIEADCDVSENSSLPNVTALSDAVSQAIRFCLPTDDSLIFRVPQIKADCNPSQESSFPNDTALSDGLSEAVCLPTDPQVAPIGADCDASDSLTNVTPLSHPLSEADGNLSENTSIWSASPRSDSPIAAIYDPTFSFMFRISPLSRALMEANWDGTDNNLNMSPVKTESDVETDYDMDGTDDNSPVKTESDVETDYDTDWTEDNSSFDVSPVVTAALTESDNDGKDKSCVVTAAVTQADFEAALAKLFARGKPSVDATANQSACHELKNSSIVNAAVSPSGSGQAKESADTDVSTLSTASENRPVARSTSRVLGYRSFTRLSDGRGLGWKVEFTTSSPCPSLRGQLPVSTQPTSSVICTTSTVSDHGADLTTAALGKILF